MVELDRPIKQRLDRSTLALAAVICGNHSKQITNINVFFRWKDRFDAEPKYGVIPLRHNAPISWCLHPYGRQDGGGNSE
jgi:hypothetical protein